MRINKCRVIVCLSLLYSSVLILINNNNLFRYFGVPIMSPDFADLRLITTASSCLQNQHWSLTSMSCDPWQRPFNYPSLWAKMFAFFGLGNDSTDDLGLIELVLLSIAIFYWVGIFYTRIKGLKQKRMFPFLVALFIFSPPVLLLAERGNVDILVFAGLTLIYDLARRGYYFIPTAILSILGSLKLYPFFGAIALISQARTRLRIAFLLVTVSIAFFSTLGELHLIAARSESDWNSISYGMSVVPLLLLRGAFAPHTKFIAAVTGLIFLVAMSLLLVLLFKSLKRPSAWTQTGTRFESFEILFISGIFLSSFVVGTSFDYRLITLLPFVLLMFVSTTSDYVSRAVFAALFLSLYFGHLTAHFGKLGLMLSAVGDFSTTVLAALALAFVVIPMKSIFLNRRNPNV